MKMYARLYYWYKTALVRSVRLLVFALLGFLIYYQLDNHQTPTIAQFLLNISVMVELFFHFKISRMMPPVPVAKNNGKDIFASFTLQATYGFITQRTIKGIVDQLVKHPPIQHLMQQATITHKDIVTSDAALDLFAKSAFDVAKTFGSKYVTSIDLFVAYLFLTEKDTRLLFAKQLKTEDLATIVSFIKKAFPEEESPKKVRVTFYGGGVGDMLVTGWTPETKKYTANFTAMALREEPLLIGRQAEFKVMVEALVKVENNNVLLVGENGSGKENLVRALAWQSFEGTLGKYLSDKHIYQLLVGPLTAGVSNRSDLEVRLQNIITEISHANNVILYVPDLQNIIGASSYNLDLSGALLPYLQAGNMPIVATISIGNYKAYMEHNSLKEAFSVVPMREPDKNTAIQMVLGDISHIEHKYKVILSYRAVASSVELADRFFQDASLPGSALGLLETVANSVSLAPLPYFDNTKRKMVLEEHVVKKVEESAHVAIALPKGDEITLLLHLEDALHEKVIAQETAVAQIAEAMRRVRSGMQTTERPISFLFLGPTGVGKTETAKALANLYYGGEKNMLRLDMSEYADETGLRRLLGAPPGQGDERGELTDKIHDNPSSLILLDEFEKANPQILNLFLQVLDDGRLTDNKGVTVSFRNCIIIATSNAGSEFIREHVGKGEAIDKKFHQELLNYLQTKAIFKPELLNRFDDIITFQPLGEEQVTQIISLLIKDLTKKLADQDITLTVDPAVVEKIAKEGFDKDFGARPLRRYIQDNLEDLIAQKKIANQLTRGKKAAFVIDGTGALMLSIT